MKPALFLKSTIFFLTLSLFISCKKKIENDLYKENLNGNIKTIIETSFSLKKSNNDTIDNLTTRKINYNKKGYLTQIKTTSKNSNSIENFIYDNFNNLTNQNYYEKNILFYSNTNKYDKENNLIERNVFNYPRQNLKSIYINNLTKDTVTILTYNKLNKLIHKKVTILKGNLKKQEIDYNGLDTLENKKLYKYNNNGLLIERTDIQFMKLYDKDNNSYNNFKNVTKYYYEYDKNNNRTKIYSSLSKKDTTFFDYKYDDINNNWTEQIYNSPYSRDLQIKKRKYLYY